MSDNEEQSSASALLARAEQAPQQMGEDHKQGDSLTIRAQDDSALVEIGVNGLGEVVEVAVNPQDVRQAEPMALAEAVLQAARAAQQQARNAAGRP